MMTHHRTCHLCEANCGLLIDVEDDCITAIRGDADDPLSCGYLCPKAYGLKDSHEDPDRIVRPMIKRDGDWTETSWNEALAFAAEGIHRVQSENGPDSVATYLGNPTAHHLPAILGGSAFIKALGSRTRFSASSVDQFPRMLAAYLVYGAQLAIPVPDLERTKHLVILGANPLVSNGSLMTAPGMKRRLREIRERGGKVVVIDPRRTETAKAADEHVFIRPGTDALFLLAVVHTIFDEDLVDLGACEGHVDNIDHLRDMSRDFTPERVSDATAIPAEVIRRMTREFAGAESAAFYSRIGTCVQAYGTLASYLVDVVNIMTGRLDRPGGMMFPQPALPLSSKGHYGKWSSRVRGIPEFGGELPVVALAEEIETPGEGQIRALFTMAGNPVLSCPNGRRLDRAFADLDFMVSVDPALNETTRHADVILPSRRPLENANYSAILLQLAVRDTGKFSPAVFPTSPDSKSEWNILADLTRKLVDLREAAGQNDLAARARAIADGFFSADLQTILDSLVSSGPYNISLQDLVDHPSGMDFGSLKQGRLSKAVQHEDGNVKLQHPQISQEISILRADLEAGQLRGVRLVDVREEPEEFLLVGRRQLRSNNSWMHNCPTLIKGPDRCTLLMHDADGRRLGLRAGQEVRVTSRVGEVRVPVQLTADMMPGVVSLPHGFGHGRPGIRARLASEHAGVSMNDLTDDAACEGLMGNAVLTGVPVRVSARAD